MILYYLLSTHKNSKKFFFLFNHFLNSIEKVLQELVKATNGLSADNNYTNIKDAMDSLIHTPVLEECACLPPDPEDVNKLLKAIVSTTGALKIILLLYNFNFSQHPSVLWKS